MRVRTALAGIADDQGLAVAHHDALDRLHVDLAARVEACDHLDGLVD
jgi:hypothetical protein